MGTIEVDALPGILLGMGVDSATLELKQIGVAGQHFVDPAAKGQNTDFQFSMAKGSKEFDRNLEVVAGVSANVGIFGGSSKASYKERCKISKKATFAMVRDATVNPPRHILGPKLTDEASDLLSFLPPKTDRFDQRFGNVYTERITDGGFFFATVRIEAASEERQHEIGVEISAKLGAFRASGSVKQGETSATSEENVEIFVFTAGGNPKPVFSLEDMLSEAQKAQQDITSGLAVPLSVSLNSYSELKLPDDEISFVQKQVAEVVMKELGESFNAHLERKNDIEFIQKHPSWFEPFKAEFLQKQLERVNRNLNTIAEAADSCVREMKCKFPVDVGLPAEPLPERKSKTKTPKRVMLNPVFKPAGLQLALKP
jgi:hypothetical protein